MPDVSIIIVNWNTRELLANCLEAVFRYAGSLSIEVIAVDNASTDGSVEMLRERFPGVRVIANAENAGFARANNQGARAAQGRYLLLLNSDAFLTEGALPALVSVAETRPDAGMVGARLLNPDGSFQASYTPVPGLAQEFMTLTGLGRLLRGPWYPSRGAEAERGPQLAGYIEGACMLAPREAYLEAGGLDEGYFMYAEEVDLCCTLARHGYTVWYQPDARVIHLGGASSRARKPQREADLYRSRVRFFRKQYGGFRAGVLLAMIVFLTAIKNVYHGALRFATRGRKGRPVVSMGQLLAALKGA